MKHLLLLILPFAPPLLAQFTGLAANGDGSILYFSSPLRLRGSAQSFYSKLFRLTAASELFRSQDPGDPIGWTFTNFYNLIAPRVSTDGSVIAFTGTRPCGGGSGCIAVQTAQGTVLDRAGNTLLTAIGSVDLSPNGRYALFFARNTFGSLISPAEFVDLATGVHTAVPYSIGASARHRIANDGTVALNAGKSIRLWQPQGEQVISGLSIADAQSFPEPFLFLSADAQRLVYQTPTGLALYDRAAPGEQPIVASAPVSAAVSDDARVIAVVNPADSQIYLTAPSRQLTQEPDGIAEVALSGDGSVAFAATTQGRVIRLVTQTHSTSTELIPRTPWITKPPNQQTFIYGVLAPGSLIPLAGVGLSASTQSAAAPLPRSLADVRIRIAGIDAAILSVSPQLVWFQIPWEVPVQAAAVFQFLSGDSQFETGPGTVNIQSVAPNIFGAADAADGYGIYSLAVHEDWSGLVTRANPAKGGEVIYLYFNGLGPVTPVVATGDASPSQPPSRITGPLRCQFWDGGPNDSSILFAGLAPGMVGINQVSLQVPNALRMTNPGITCDFGRGTPFAVGSTFVAPSSPNPTAY